MERSGGPDSERALRHISMMYVSMMYATMSCDGTGTAHGEFDLQWERAVAAGDRRLEPSEGNAWIYENRIRFLGRLGAVVGHSIKCRPRSSAGVVASQQIDRRPVPILAGYMSQSRGLAWDRRSRKGRK